jgi:hypothetical protein
VKKIIVGVISEVVIFAILVAFAVVAYVLYISYDDEGNTTTTTTTEYDPQQVDEDYFGTINENISLAQLRNSGVVYEIQVLSEGTPFETAYIFIYRAVVANIDEDKRIITIQKGGDTLSFYIGINADIQNGSGDGLGLKECDIINVGATIQVANGYPFSIHYITVSEEQRDSLKKLSLFFFCFDTIN